ncbi:aminoglycoside adenylyltransferase family protein [Streptomyces endophyticus]|uniref:Aminoglycoside adenylyltransferase family protein n=1 Tax=Streptomyces endophyticus TaxID=714166 RepID=A0ABU6F3D2_9ACTN|nr:aminoglycoside adenylyltransferase family protein [Streptomyces endophyticus]MEB8338514.1 aminoglycoside adenylyltransferase family protein [Streptomyces endophyticus]
MRQEERVVEALREALGPDLVAAYLYGSAVSGGLRPHSDVDVFAVTGAATTHDQRARLVGGLMELSGQGAAHGQERPVELTLVQLTAVRPWRFPPVREFQYGEWLRDAYERGETPSPEVDEDLALLVTMVRQRGVALFGPPATELLEPVPEADVRRATTAGIPELLAELETDTRNVVLTLARVWATLATGEILSKDAAADWALARLPEEERDVLTHARAVYLGGTEESWTALRPLLRRQAQVLVDAARAVPDVSGSSRNREARPPGRV